MTIKLLLADDHVLMREGLKQLLALDSNIRVVAEAGNGEEVLALLAWQPVDVLLLDLSMPGVSGPELVKQIARQWPFLPVLVLSMHNEPQIAQAVLASGAQGFVTKDQDPKTLLTAIHRVAEQQRYIDPTLAEAIIFASQDSGHLQRYELLSLREKQIMRLLSEGNNVNTIAENLNISNKTVSTHKARMMEKMQFASNADIIKFAIKYHK
ncbi:response regulator transcription factor [Paramixta manurensis]|uniref:Response regulator transcription factor n=1 Tax=Paramixta manurensis TaxID=2740817 RepID=A0A6M8U6P3_9GAMM|nr:response regulator transcription factor [Erwiniaceae bacterium PD-1]